MFVRLENRRTPAAAHHPGARLQLLFGKRENRLAFRTLGIHDRVLYRLKIRFLSLLLTPIPRVREC